MLEDEELFTLYKAELTLRIRNERNLSRYGQVLEQFQEFLGNNPPSSMLANFNRSGPLTGLG